MDYTKDLSEVMYACEVAGDGEVTISTDGSYYGEEVSRDFTIEDLEKLLEAAKAHKEAYDAYVANDYEDVK